MEHECVGAVVLVESALALRFACFRVTTGGPCGKKPTPFFAARAPVVTKVGRSWASDSLPSTGVDVQSFVGLFEAVFETFLLPSKRNSCPDRVLPTESALAVGCHL